MAHDVSICQNSATNTPRKTPHLFMIRKSSDKFVFFGVHPRKFNIAPEKIAAWKNAFLLERFGKVTFQGQCQTLGGYLGYVPGFPQNGLA